MEPLRKSLKSHCSYAKQQEDLKEEEQALLYHHNDCHMAESTDSCCTKEGEVVVKIDSTSNVNGKETENASKSNTKSSSSKLPGSSKKVGFSFEEVLTEAVWRKTKDFSDQENHHLSSNSGGDEVVKCSSNAFFGGQRTWRSLMKKTKSRLMDPPEEQYQRTESVMNSHQVFGNDHDHEEDDIEDIPEEYKKMKFSALTIFQWVSLVLILGALVCSLSIPVIKRQTLWDLPLWKWELLVLALICGRLVSGWGIRVVVIFIERNFLLRKRVLYFVYGLRKAVQNCIWLGLVLIVWHLIFGDKVKEETKSQILPYVTRILVCFLVGTVIWLLKTLLVKVLASSFHVNTFFERIQEALFNQYVIETLSGPPLFERHIKELEERPAAEAQEFQIVGAATHGDLRVALLAKSGSEMGSGKLHKCLTVGKNPRFLRAMSKKQDQEIPIDHLHKLNQKNISAWNMRRMINIISHGALSTLDEQILNSDIEDESSLQIKTECQAKEAAKKIFHKVAKPGSLYIHLEDVMRFMGKDEALKTMHQFGPYGNDCEGISKSSLNKWVVNAFRERKALALSLNDTKTAVDELHNMLSILVAIIIAIIWLIILGIPISNFLVFVSSQLLLVVFIFGNTCKTVFEAIVFLFIMHPFDVGDRCEVDGVQMIVEEMNILTTVFLRVDNQKITYPNSVLATKAIGNFHRSPDMTETIDFCIHITTPVEKISLMKERLISYIESKNDQWHHTPKVVVKDVEDMNRINMSLWLTHRMNYQNVVERWARRGLVVEEIIKICRDFDIEYRMLPLDVNVRNITALSSNRLPSNWTTCQANST